MKEKKDRFLFLIYSVTKKDVLSFSNLNKKKQKNRLICHEIFLFFINVFLFNDTSVNKNKKTKLILKYL